MPATAAELNSLAKRFRKVVQKYWTTNNRRSCHAYCRLAEPPGDRTPIAAASQTVREMRRARIESEFREIARLEACDKLCRMLSDDYLSHDDPLRASVLQRAIELGESELRERRAAWPILLSAMRGERTAPDRLHEAVMLALKHPASSRVDIDGVIKAVSFYCNLLPDADAGAIAARAIKHMKLDSKADD